MSNRVAFYLRSATANTEDLKRQQKHLEHVFCRQKVGFTDSLVEVYIDTHQSGLRSGPEFMRMCRDVESGKISVIAVERMNRISRSLKGLQGFFEFVRKSEIRFISVRENVDSKVWHSSVGAR